MIVSIRDWHYGKIVLLWAWGAVLTAYGLHVLPGLGVLAGTLVLVLVVAIPVALSVVTWKWLGGKDRRAD